MQTLCKNSRVDKLRLTIYNVFSVDFAYALSEGFYEKNIRNNYVNAVGFIKPYGVHGM